MQNSPTDANAEDTARSRVSRAIRFWLDEPTDWNVKQSHLLLSGWCFVTHGEPDFELLASVDEQLFPIYRRTPRPDVVAHHPDLAVPLDCGFAAVLIIPAGKHRISLRAITRDGRSHKLVKREVRGPRFVRARPSREQAESAGDQPTFGGRRLDLNFDFWIDEPQPWPERARHLRISGWCVSLGPAKVRQIRVQARGRKFAGIHGLTRADVAAKFGRNPAALHSGFSVDVIVPPGPATLTLEARTEGSDDWKPLFEKRIAGSLFWRDAGESEEIGHYREWIRLYDHLTNRDRRKIRAHIETFTRRPRFSVLVPVFNPEARWLERAIESVRGQLYPDWELCLVDDASTTPQVWPILQRAAQRDSRIKIFRRNENGHIAAASNDALGLAQGDYVALLDHDDELAPTALYFAALALNQSPDLRFIYTDEDKIDYRGRRTDPAFKPDWNPGLLRSQNYIAHLAIFETRLLRELGGFRVGYEGAQDYDLTLRVAEAIDLPQIHHIPRVLYHWRQTPDSTALAVAAKPYARDAGMRAVQEHLDRRGVAGRVEPGFGDFLRVRYAAPTGNPLVSIVIPTRDQSVLLRRTVESILAKTDGVNLELIIIDNDSRDPETAACLAELERLDRVRVLPLPGQFNFSRLNNFGAAQARGEFVAFLNNDLEIVNRDWLAEMLGHAAQPEVGAVGARLWFPDGSLQHGGLLLGLGSVAAPVHYYRTAKGGYVARTQLIQNFSALTAACLLMKKRTFEEIGRFDEINLPVAFNDVDLCLRLRARNFDLVWTPYAELIHHESSSRGYEDTRAKQERFAREAEWMRKRWGSLLQADPFYNPNLSLQREAQFRLAFPPRVTNPWSAS